MHRLVTGVKPWLTKMYHETLLDYHRLRTGDLFDSFLFFHAQILEVERPRFQVVQLAVHGPYGPQWGPQPRKGVHFYARSRPPSIILIDQLHPVGW